MKEPSKDVKINGGHIVSATSPSSEQSRDSSHEKEEEEEGGNLQTDA